MKKIITMNPKFPSEIVVKSIAVNNRNWENTVNRNSSGCLVKIFLFLLNISVRREQRTLFFFRLEGFQFANLLHFYVQLNFIINL